MIKKVILTSCDTIGECLPKLNKLISETHAGDCLLIEYDGAGKHVISGPKKSNEVLGESCSKS